MIFECNSDDNKTLHSMIRQIYDSAIMITVCHASVSVSSWQDTLIDSLRGQKYVDTQ